MSAGELAVYNGDCSAINVPNARKHGSDIHNPAGSGDDSVMVKDSAFRSLIVSDINTLKSEV